MVLDEVDSRRAQQKGYWPAMHVLNTLKPGLDEKIYENTLVLELRAAGRMIEQQRQFPVNVGTLIPDLVVDRSVSIDRKVVSAFTGTHTAQMAGYLAVTGLPILISFKNAKLDFKRYRETRPGEHP
jgi:GxxExxY protein